MLSIKEALYAKLSGDATLTAMLSTGEEIYYAYSPSTASLPCITYRQLSRQRIQGGDRDDELYQVSAFAGDPDTSDRMAERIRVLLDAQPLVASGRRVDFVGVVTDSETFESDPGEFHHALQVQVISYPTA